MRIKHILHDKNLLIASAIALVIGLGAGYGIHGLVSPSLSLSRGGGFQNGPGNTTSSSSRSARGINQANGGLLTGTVASKDSNSITIDTRDGNSRIILVTPNTNVSKNATGSINDVAVGSTIFVSGTTNSDGSISASLVQLRPASPTATMGR